MLLAIDTSGDRAGVALGTPNRVRAEETIIGARRHAGVLLPMIDRVLGAAGVPPAGLEGIVLADGPGSFTGLRVGAAVAKALSDTHGTPLWTASALLVLAAGLPRDGRCVLAASDALRGEIYLAAYRVRLGVVETLLPPTVRAPAEVPALGLPVDLVCGAAPHPVLETLAAALGARFAPPPSGGPRAADLLALAGMPGGAVPVPDPAGWEPDYGRPAEAQRRWEVAHGRVLPHP